MSKFFRNKTTLRCAQGLGLSFGSPLGWLTIRVFSGASPLAELQHHTGVYLYMLIGTAIVFTLFATYVGNAEANLEKMSLVDPLTKVYNNRYFHDRLHHEFALYKRKKTPLSLILLDLDHFKKVNDQYGHLVGDKVLIKISQEIQKQSRSGEVLARVGGEEFCMILANCDKEQAIQTANRFHRLVQNTVIPYDKGKELKVTGSFGVANTTGLGEDKSEWDLYNLADQAMYQAKQQGRNRVVAL